MVRSRLRPPRRLSFPTPFPRRHSTRPLFCLRYDTKIRVNFLSFRRSLSLRYISSASICHPLNNDRPLLSSSLYTCPHRYPLSPFAFLTPQRYNQSDAAQSLGVRRGRAGPNSDLLARIDSACPCRPLETTTRLVPPGSSSKGECRPESRHVGLLGWNGLGGRGRGRRGPVRAEVDASPFCSVPDLLTAEEPKLSLSY
jgi:hypothetical protein